MALAAETAAAEPPIESLDDLVSDLRQATDAVARLQRSLEICLDRAERAVQRPDPARGDADGRTLHLVGRPAADVDDGGTPLVAPMRIHGFEVDAGRHTVSVEGRRVLLTPNEWQLFAHMLSQPGRTLSREELAVGAWGQGFGGRDSEVEVYISRLRRKLESRPRSPLMIETIRGSGYRLVPPEDPELDLVDARRPPDAILPAPAQPPATAPDSSASRSSASELMQ